MSIVADKYKIYAGDIGINKKPELKKGTQGKRQSIYSDGLFNFIYINRCAYWIAYNSINQSINSQKDVV